MRKTLLLSIGTTVGAAAFIAGSVPTFLAFTLFLVGIVGPCWVLTSTVLERLLGEDAEVDLLSAVCTIVLLVPLYMLRKGLSVHAEVADSLIGAALWVAAWRTGSFRRATRRIATSEFDPAALIWVAIVLPIVFCLSWLGNAVVTGNAVRFWGLYYIDFSWLVAVTNLVRTGPLLPQSPVIDTGPLGYHWFYFALPAWGSEFLGLRGQASNSLMLVNLLTGALFYLGLVRTCRRLGKTADGPGVGVAHLCGVALFGLSTVYAYQLVLRQLNLPWLTLGTRNSLLLQLPHSLACFGNNTFTLLVALVTITTLTRWNDTGKIANLVLAALMIAILPGYSVTLVLPIALGILLWTLTGNVRLPVVTLGVFCAIGAVALALFYEIGLFAYSANSSKDAGLGLALSLDGGKFVQNVLLGFLPVTGGVFLWFRKCRNRMLLPFFCMAAASMAIPTLLMMRNTVTANVDLSMKTGSLYLTVLAPVCVQAASWLLGARQCYKKTVVLALLVVAGGLTNSATYVLQYAASRALGRGSRYLDIPIDYFHALEFIATLRPNLSVIDEMANQFEAGFPTLMVGGKRVLFPTDSEEQIWHFNAEVMETKRVWRSWKAGGHVEEQQSRFLAEKADLMVSNVPLSTRYWLLLGRFGDTAVYQSAIASRRPGDRGSVARE